jgi:hypothetical protein
VQEEIVEKLRASVVADPRIRAAWLGGSLGRGDADRYSDVDLHLLIATGQAQTLRVEAPAWLARHADLVLCRAGGRRLNALTTDGLRLDVWLHEEGERQEGYSSLHSRVLHDPAQLLLEPTLEAREPLGPGRGERLLAGIEEFWRCLSLLPALAGRGELIVGVQELGVELGLVSRIVLDGLGIDRDAGHGKLNQALPEELRGRLEAAIASTGQGVDGMKRAHLALAEIVAQLGPTYAERHGVTYPKALEEAVLRYLRREL